MGYKVVWDEKKQRYVPAKGESTAKKETYSWASYKANNKSSSKNSNGSKKTSTTVDPIKTALGQYSAADAFAQAKERGDIVALPASPEKVSPIPIPNYTGGGTMQYVSSDLTPGAAGIRDYNRFSTNLPGYQEEYLKNVYKPGGSNTLKMWDTANKLGNIANNSENIMQNIMAEAESLGLSEDDMKAIMERTPIFSQLASEYEAKTRARTGDKTVLNGMPMSKEAKEYERLLNLYGRDQVHAALNKKTSQPSKANVSSLFDSPDVMTRWLEGQYEAGDDAFDKQMQSILAEKNTIGSRAEMYNNYSREEYRNDLNVIYSYNNPAKRGNLTEDDYMRAMVRAQAATGQDFKSAVSNGLDVNWFKDALDAYDSGQKSMYEELKASGALDQDMSYEDYLDNMEAVNAQAAMQEKKQQRMEDWKSQTSAQSAQIQGSEDYGATSAYRQDNSIGQLTPNADYLSGNKIYYDAEGNAMRPEEYRQAVIDSILNEYVAAGDDADARAALEGYSGLIPELQNYNLEAIPYMSDEQKSNFFYLYNSGDKNGARAYLEALDYGLQAQRYQDMVSQYTADMRENTSNKVLGSIASVPRNLMNNLAGAGVWAANTLGLDTYADMHEFNPLFDYTTKTQIARGETGQAFANATDGFEILGMNIPQAIYEAVMSASDSALNAYLFGRAGSATMGSGAYMSGLQQNLMAGDDRDKAHQDASAQGLIEIGTEYVSIDRLLSDVTNPVKYFIQNALVEGSEEGASTILNTVYDNLVNGGESEINQRINELMTQGYTRNDAKWAAWVEWGKGLFGDVFTGVLSGGVSSGPRAAAIYASDAGQGRTIAANETQQPILDIAASLDLDVDTMKLVQEQQEALNALKESEQQTEVLPEREEFEFDGTESSITPVKPEQQIEKLPNREAEAPDGKLSSITPVDKKSKKEKKTKAPKVSNAKMGRIVREAMRKLDAQAQRILSDSFKTEVTQELQGRGYKGNLQAAADAIVKMATGMTSQITPEVMQAAVSEKAVLDLVNEYTAPIRQRNELITLGAKGYQNPAKATTEVPDEAEETPAESTIGGKTVKVTGLKSVGDDGTAMVEIVDADGNVQEVDMEEVAFGAVDEGVAAMARMASNLGRNADTFLNNINEGQDQAEYAEAFETAMNFGRDGRNLDKTKSSEVLTNVLTPEQIDIAYNLGKNTRQQNARMVRKNASGISVGNVDTSGINMSTLSRSQRASVNAVGRLAKAIGFNVRFVESKANALGKYTTENGSWDARTMTMTLDVHAGSNYASDTNYAMMHTAGHELTHYIKDFADSGLWNEYQEFVIGHLSENMDETALEAKIQQHMRANPNLNRDGAIEEIIADASGDALMNISEAEIQQIAETNPGLFNKLKAFFEKWIGNLKKYIDAAYKGTEAKTAEAKAMHDVVDQLSEKWNKLLVNAAQNQKVASEATSADTTVEAAIMEAAGESLNTDGNKLFSLRTMQEDKDEFRSMLIKHGKMSATEITKLFNTIDHLMDEIEDNRHVLDFGENIDSDKRSFTPVKPNSDPLYQVSVDFSTLCRKRLLQQVCQERLEAAMGRAVTKAERVAIRDELIKLQQQGKQIEVACALCYVESARLKSPAQIQRFMDNRAEVIRNYYARRNEGVKAAMQTAEAEYRRVNNLGDQSLKNLPGTVAKKVRAAKNAPIANYRVSAQEQKTIDKAMSMSVSDFTSAESLWKLKRSDPELFDIYTSYIRNATKSKGIEGDTPWKAGDSKTISDELIRKMNQENGLRSQSWSDFQTYHILDYIAAVIELSTRDAKMQVYTKVPAYVKLMGETGAMINMSLIPAAKFDGTLQYDDVEGFVHEQAFELRNRYPDTAGTICIGIDDKQIDMLLENDDIDYVIPYHRSGMDAATRRKMRIPTWHDYESQQNEKALGKDAGKAPKFSEWFDYKMAAREAREANNTAEGKAAIAAGDVMYGAKIAMQNAAQRYKNLCAERNLAPKFQKFKDNPGYWKLLIDRKMINNVTGEIIEQKALQPVFDEDTLIEICQDEVAKFNQTNADFQYAVDAVLDAYESGTLSKAAKSEKVQQAVRDHENWMAVQAAIGSQEQAVEGKRFSGRMDADYQEAYEAREMSERERNRALRKGEMVNEFYGALKDDWPAYYDKINNDIAYSPDRFYDGDRSYMIIGDKLLILEMQRNGEFSVIDVYKSDAFAYNNGIENEWFEDLWRDNGYDEETFINWVATFANDGGEEVPQRYDRVRKRFVSVEQGQKRLRKGDDQLYRSGTQRAGVLEASAEEGETDLKYQQRDFSELSDRELLVEALQTELSPEERDHIERYSKKVEELNRKQMQLEALNEEIIRLRAKANDFASREELRKAETNAKTLRNSIANADKALSKVESAQMIREVIKRNRAEVRRKTAAQYKESYGKEKYRARILEDAKRLYGWVVSPTNKGYVPEFLREPLAGFIESIDFTSARQLRGGDPTKNDAKFTEALEKLRRAIGEINKQQADIEGGATSFAGYIDLPADYMQEFDELVGKIKTTLDMSDNYTETPFARMKADQLHDLAKLFRILNSSISKVNRLVANGRYESAKTASNDTISDMNARNAKVKTNKLLSSLNSMFNWKNTTPYYAFQRLGRGGKAIFEGLQDGWDKMAQNSARLINFAEDAFTSKQAKEWSRDIKNIKLDSGDSFQITAAQAMSLYCLSKRQQAVGHLMGGGIRISDIDMGKGNTLSQVDNYVLSEADLLRIIGTLTAEQRSVADKLQNFMNTVCTDWGNEISMKRFGYKMFTEKFYFPIETDANNRSKIDDKQDGKTSLFRLLNMSAMKSLTPNANNAIIVRDIFDVFSNHASDIGKYNALALPILDFIKWYNYVEKVDVLDANGKATGKFTTKSTQKALERAYGTDAKQYVLSFIRDMNAEHDGGRNDTVLSKLMGQAKAGSVSANMRVAFLQITSLPRAAYAIDPKYLLKGMAKVKSLNPATAIKGSEAQENIGILKWKNLGFYSTDVSRNTRSMVRRDESTISKIRDLVMKPAEWGDNWTSNIIYEAVKAEMSAKHPNVKPGTKAYDAMLNKRVREIVYKTQVVDSTMTRSDFMRSKGLMTAFTAFMSEPTLTVNMLNESIQEAVMNARTGMSARDNLRSVGGKAVRAATVMAFTATASAFVEAIFDALRDDDDYEEFREKFADAFGGNIVDNVNVFAMLPFLKDAISIMQGYENSSMVTQVVSQYKDVQESITAWQEGKRPIYSVIYNMLKVAASATGVGVQNATRDGVGLYNTFLADAFNTPKIQTYSDSKSKAAEEFYEALQAGDEEKVEWIMQRAEINGIALPDISDKIATLVKNEFVAGDITEEEATRRLIEYGGKDENEAYWKIQEWGYSGEGNFSKYTSLKDALKSGDHVAANAARDELAEHGTSEQAISGQLSEIYNNGEATSILNLQMRSDSLYTSSLKLKADGEAHPDDFDAFITAIVNGGNISGEIESLMDKGYTVKQCMSAINGAFGKNRDTYRIMEKYNSSDAGILLDRILDAYEYLGLDRAEEIAWIDANWIM